MRHTRHCCIILCSCWTVQQLNLHKHNRSHQQNPQAMRVAPDPLAQLLLGCCRGRKAQQRWTDEEVELLIRAREVLGNNTQWAVEALSRWDFGGRENIHLHDKWKNMVRSVKEQKTTRGVRLTQEQCDRIQQVREPV